MGVIAAEIFQNEHTRYFLSTIFIADFFEEKHGIQFRFGMNSIFPFPKRNRFNQC